MREDAFATPAELNVYSAANRLGYLIGCAQNVVDRWDSPLWKDLPNTAFYIEQLRKAIQEAKP